MFSGFLYSLYFLFIVGGFLFFLNGNDIVSKFVGNTVKNISNSSGYSPFAQLNRSAEQDRFYFKGVIGSKEVAYISGRFVSKDGYSWVLKANDSSTLTLDIKVTTKVRIGNLNKKSGVLEISEVSASEFYPKPGMIVVYNINEDSLLII